MAQLGETSGWQTVCDKLDEFVRVAGAAGEAIAGGDAPLARFLVHETRGIRAALARASSYTRELELPATPQGFELAQRVHKLREQSLIADRIARAWIGRELPDDETLKKLEGGYLAIADRLLPPTWDVEIDVIALIGDGGADLVHALAAFGQTRVLVYADDDDSTLYPEGTVFATAKGDLSKMLSFAQPPPERLKVHVMTPTSDESARVRDVEESFGALILGKNTVGEFGRLWLRQGLFNWPQIASVPSIAAVGDRFVGVPMVIVAPGPSLEKNVSLLRELDGVAIIATFSHTLSALRAAGIRPNIVLAVDMEDLRYHFDDYPIEEVDVLALGLTVVPSLFRLGARSIMTFAGNSRVDQWLCDPLGDEMALPSGGSVAHSAFSLARRWGCNPIVLVGQDLAFEGGKVYCASNVDGETAAIMSADGATLTIGGWSAGYSQLESIGGRSEGRAEAAIKVPAASGGEVITSAAFALFRRWFIDAATGARESGVELFNCTEGGAFIDGWEHISLREAIDTKLASGRVVDIAAAFAEVGRVDAVERQTRVLGRLREIETAVARAGAVAARCHVLAGSNRAHTERGAARLASAERSLRAALTPIEFIALAAQGEVLRGAAEARDQTDLASNLRASRRLYGAIMATCEEVKPWIAESIARLASEGVVA